MNALLTKQLTKLGLDPSAPPDAEAWSRLLARLHETYDAWDQDRYLLEQAMEVSSQELRELMEQLKSRNEELQDEVTHHARTAERLRYSATHDLLTGLASRQMLLELLGQALIRIREQPDPGYSVMFIDLDGFKKINDTLGHEAGDAVLVEVANVLRGLGETYAHCKPSVARIGGDEFVILLREVTEPDDAHRFARDVCDAVCKPFDASGHRVRVGASVGIAYGDQSHESANDVLRDADLAMYRAKSMGKGRFAEFDRRMHGDLVSRLATEQSIRDSIESGLFISYYQPKIDLASGDIIGFEALLRWSHPEHGVLTPEAFLPVAEASGMIVPLGETALRQVCRDLSMWTRHHPDAFAGITVSINLGLTQIVNPETAPRFLQVLEEEGVSPRRFNVEVAEKTMLAEPDRVRETLATLSRAGVGVHVDDFGAGDSSLTVLNRFPCDVVKVDRRLIARATGDRNNAAIVSAIIGLAHNLGLTVVAEGIERLEQIAQLQAWECHQGQGFYFSRPMPPDEARHNLLNQARRWQFQHRQRSSIRRAS